MGIAHDLGARAERAAARLLGGVRTGNRGTAAADVVSDWAAIEVKSRATVPAWLKHAVAQAETAATGYVSPRLPVVVVHEVGGRHADDLVLVPLAAFRAWFDGWCGECDEVGEVTAG